MKITFSQFTSAGLVRSNNQDSLLSVSDGDFGLFVVADGMGGHFGGEIASGRLVDKLKKWWDTFCADRCEFDVCCEQLKGIITNVNDSIYTEYSQNGKICGTTVALVLIYENKYLLINAGDSRVYSLDKGKLKQESVDHVFAVEAKIKGELTDDEINEHRNKNKLTSAVGCKQQFKMNVRTAPLEDSTFFICSDGVYKYCDESDIKSAMKQKDYDKAAEQIKQKVEDSGAGDNFSFIKITLGEGGAAGLDFSVISDLAAKIGTKKIAVIAAAVIVLVLAMIIAVNSKESDIEEKAESESVVQNDTDISVNTAANTETSPATGSDYGEEVIPLKFDSDNYTLEGKPVKFIKKYKEIVVVIDDVEYYPRNDLNEDQTQPETSDEESITAITTSEERTEPEATESGSETTTAPIEMEESSEISSSSVAEEDDIPDTEFGDDILETDHEEPTETMAEGSNS